MKQVYKKKSKCNNKLKIMVRDICFICIVFLVISTISSKNYASNYINKKEITVQKSNTLWTIASKICKEDSKLKIESVISDIKEINNMDNCDIFDGQTLYIPVYNI